MSELGAACNLEGCAARDNDLHDPSVGDVFDIANLSSRC